jgi:hypothetical protein
VNNIGKNLALWVIIVVLLVALYNIFQGTTPRGPSQPIAYSDFMAEVDRNQVSAVKIKGPSISGTFRDGRAFVTYAPSDPQLVDRLRDKNVRIEAGPEQEPTNIFISSIISWLPFLVVLGLWVFFMRQMQSGGRGAMGFGKSRAKLLTEKVGRVTFEDVAGIDEAKQELEEIVEFLRDPQKFQRLGGKIPKGVLLVGPPGTGKTLLARSIAGEANVPFFTISGSDFVEMFVGVGASRVRDMFEQGKKNAPCIIFIDEIDAVGRHRGAGPGRRQRRARADSQPAAGRDGRLRVERGRDPHRRDQPSRRARPGTAAPRPLRPPGRGAEPRRRWTREDPQGPHAQGAAGAGRRCQGDRARHTGLLGRRSCQPGQRGALLAARRGKRSSPWSDFEDPPRTR